MMTRRSLLLLGAACAFALPLSIESADAQSKGGFFFRDGDRAMILGDSITEQKMYSTLIESYVLSRYPKWQISFRNTGWGGDTMGLGTRGNQDNGFERDLKPLAPTAVTIDFGMNDARAGDGGYDSYLANARTLTDKFAAIGARVALVTPSAEERYEENQPAGSAYNLMLRKYSQGLASVATEKKTVFVDQLNPMITTIEAGRGAKVLSSTASDSRLIPDGVHPNWAGHLVMAAHILKGLNAPSNVSSVEIDARTGKARSTKATVTAITSGATLSFTRLDESLPWPVPNDAALALQIPGFKPLDELSRYMLKVTNLKALNYRLTIDGQEAGTFTRQQLGVGVNLSRSAGPITEQTNKLLASILDKNYMFYQRWRQVQLDGTVVPAWLPKDVLETARSTELKRLDEGIAATEASINTLRLPIPHLWSLSPVI